MSDANKIKLAPRDMSRAIYMRKEYALVVPPQIEQQLIEAGREWYFEINKPETIAAARGQQWEIVCLEDGTPYTVIETVLMERPKGIREALEAEQHARTQAQEAALYEDLKKTAVEGLTPNEASVTVSVVQGNRDAVLDF